MKSADFTSYPEALNWLMNHLPMFQRVGRAAYRKDLTNIRRLSEAIGNPHRQFPSIHIAGTNGKGSTSHLLASILQEAGYKTGLTTSPHLVDFRERIRINGTMIAEEAVVDFVNMVKNTALEIQPSFFEMAIAMAFWYFNRERVDVAVVETGMGGRLDSTNIITPILSVITNIGMDHTEFLGHTLEAIAAEKAGIIKPAVPVVIGRYQPETLQIFIAKAQENNSPLKESYREFTARFEGDDVVIEHLGNIWARAGATLQGLYQLENYATVAAAVEVLRSQGWKIERRAVENGITRVCKNTGLAGRWHIVSQKPFIVLDTGHNPDGYRFVAEQFQALPHRNKWALLGFTREKNPAELIRLLSPEVHLILAPMSVPRSRSFPELLNGMDDIRLLKGSNIQLMGSVESALKFLQSALDKDDALLVGGSSFMVADYLRLQGTS